MTSRGRNGLAMAADISAYASESSLSRSREEIFVVPTLWFGGGGAEDFSFRWSHRRTSRVRRKRPSGKRMPPAGCTGMCMLSGTADRVGGAGSTGGCGPDGSREGGLTPAPYAGDSSRSAAGVPSGDCCISASSSTLCCSWPSWWSSSWSWWCCPRAACWSWSACSVDRGECGLGGADGVCGARGGGPGTRRVTGRTRRP